MAAAQKRTEAHAPADIENTDAFRRMEFVAGQGKHVHRQFLKIDWHLSNSLHSVCVEQDTALMGKTRHLFNGKDIACLIIGKHAGDKGCVGGKRLQVFISVKRALLINRKPCDTVALPLPELHRVQNGWMFNTGCDDMPFFGRILHRRPDGGIVGFRSARREEDLIRCGMQQISNLGTGLCDRTGHLAAERVHA